MEKPTHEFKLINRGSFYATGVLHVDNYDEKLISMETTLGLLKIKGEELTVKNLNLQEGVLEVTGVIDELIYSQQTGKKTKRFMERIFK